MKTYAKDLIIIFLASVLFAFSLNVFLLPHKVLVGGVTGISMILEITTGLKTGWTNFAINVPIFILGYFYLGKRFITYSIFSVIVSTAFLQIIPVHMVADDLVVSALFGGALSGVAIGMIIKHSGSTGGVDIIGLVLTKNRDFPLGFLLTTMNSLVILLSGFIFGWEITLYTLISIYVSGKVIDSIHTNHAKLTLQIVTTQGLDIKCAIIEQFGRGVTIMRGKGGYTEEEKYVLMTVLTRYELNEAKQVIRGIDPNAFINITQTIQLVGSFNKEPKRKMKL